MPQYGCLLILLQIYLGTVLVDPLERASSISISLLSNTAIVGDALCDSLIISDAEIATDANIDALVAPESISLLEPLGRPKVVGKDYRERDAAETDAVFGKPRERRTVPNRGNRTPKTPVVDVFEQLRYILQPPILPPDGQPVVFPNGLKPYPFQITGVNWLTEHKEALLADQMGLGKTVQAIIAMRVLFRKGELQSVLVLCPASMTTVWEREIKSWAPELRQLRIQGAPWIRTDAWKSPAEIYIVSYETLRNDVWGLARDKFDLLILDEAQKIKNPGTQTHLAVKQLIPQYRWALTGTPIENKVGDAVALFAVLKPGLFNRFSERTAGNDEVRRKIEPYLLRRTIEEARLELPELTHQDHWLDLEPGQQRSYSAREKAGVADIASMGSSATRIHVLALITKLKQICNYDDANRESCKLNFLKDQLESLTDGSNDKALIFSQYPVKTLQKIEPELNRFKPLTFDGALSAKRRDEVVSKFQESDDNVILLMSVRAGGIGLTLTRANHVFHFDHWWNPAVVDQASARVRRIGQSKPVFVHSLYALDTIEERIFSLLQEKRAVFQAVFGGKAAADDDDMENLTDEDLFGLFGLNVPRKGETNDFQSMSPREFEEAIRDFFAVMGYKLSVTKQSGDGGIDLDGHRMGLGGGRIVVQCKRYKGTVSVSAVRDLFGVVASDNNIEKGFLVTTGDFSRDARKFAAGKRITLIDGVALRVRSSDIGGFKVA